VGETRSLYPGAAAGGDSLGLDLIDPCGLGRRTRQLRPVAPSAGSLALVSRYGDAIAVAVAVANDLLVAEGLDDGCSVLVFLVV
jgi:hypothetical protein